MTSTTIEAILELFENNITGKFGDKITKEDALKAIEAERLRGQIEVLEYLRQNAGYGEYTATEYRDSIELRIQSLQQQLDSIEEER